MKIVKKVLAGIGILIAVVLLVQIINAAKYKMVVNVVEGENIMGINPLADKLDFGDLSRNNGMTRYVAFKNGGGVPIFIAAFKVGGISDLIELNKNYFVLKPGEEFKLAYEISIPPSAQVKKYSGWTVIFRIPKPF